jgi:hypothetical protein
MRATAIALGVFVPTAGPTGRDGAHGRRGDP